jgi:hypothetical protein
MQLYLEHNLQLPSFDFSLLIIEVFTLIMLPSVSFVSIALMMLSSVTALPQYVFRRGVELRSPSFAELRKVGLWDVQLPAILESTSRMAVALTALLAASAKVV